MRGEEGEETGGGGRGEEREEKRGEGGGEGTRVEARVQSRLSFLLQVWLREPHLVQGATLTAAYI